MLRHDCIKFVGEMGSNLLPRPGAIFFDHSHDGDGVVGFFSFSGIATMLASKLPT
jgi:hypothetical protein